MAPRRIVATALELSLLGAESNSSALTVAGSACRWQRSAHQQ
jgi:hypothetical protein